MTLEFLCDIQYMRNKQNPREVETYCFIVKSLQKSL